MITKSEAAEIRDLALTAVESLSHTLEAAAAKGDAEFAERVRKGVGISIGTIEVRLLSVIYDIYPELDPLK
jgi:hypothetical protein